MNHYYFLVCLILIVAGKAQTSKVRDLFSYKEPAFTNEKIVVLDEYIVTKIMPVRLQRRDEVPRDIERYLDSISRKSGPSDELNRLLQKKPKKITFVAESKEESFSEKFFFLDKGPELQNFSRRLRGGIKIRENATLYIKTGIRWNIGLKKTELYFPYRRRNVFGVGLEKDWQSSIRLLDATQW